MSKVPSLCVHKSTCRSIFILANHHPVLNTSACNSLLTYTDNHDIYRPIHNIITFIMLISGKVMTLITLFV